MSEIAVTTTRPAVNDRSYGYGATSIVEVWFVANTSTATKYIMAPSNGVLKEFNVQGTVTSDATKTYTLTCVNKSNSDAAMIGTTVYDADPVLTAFTAASATLSTTAANLAVDDKDMILLTHTGGTGSGDVVVQLIFELA